MDGFPDSPTPFEFQVGQVCEAFHCTPTQALAELENAPNGLVHTVMLCLAYAETKRQIDGEKDITRQPTGRLADLCRVIDADIMVKERERQRLERERASAQ